FRMLRDVLLNLGVSGFDGGILFRVQILFGISRRKGACLLQQDLQLNVAFLLKTRGCRFSSINQNLAQLMLGLLYLFLRNLRALQLRIAFLSILNELVESLFLARLFEES